MPDSSEHARRAHTADRQAISRLDHWSREVRLREEPELPFTDLPLAPTNSYWVRQWTRFLP